MTSTVAPIAMRPGRCTVAPVGAAVRPRRVLRGALRRLRAVVVQAAVIAAVAPAGEVVREGVVKGRPQGRPRWPPALLIPAARSRLHLPPLPRLLLLLPPLLRRQRQLSHTVLLPARRLLGGLLVPVAAGAGRAERACPTLVAPAATTTITSAKFEAAGCPRRAATAVARPAPLRGGGVVRCGGAAVLPLRPPVVVGVPVSTVVGAIPSASVVVVGAPVSAPVRRQRVAPAAARGGRCITDPRHHCTARRGRRTVQLGGAALRAATARLLVGRRAGAVAAATVVVVTGLRPRCPRRRAPPL